MFNLTHANSFIVHKLQCSELNLQAGYNITAEYGFAVYVCDATAAAQSNNAGLKKKMIQTPVYLDYNATTPCHPDVVAAMLPFFTNWYGNAASNNHSYGWQAAEGVAIAREQVAALINASAEEIVFTSGATEAINLAIKGVLLLLLLNIRQCWILVSI
jgi:selenocysteine lyase/cysteine desulfurase